MAAPSTATVSTAMASGGEATDSLASAASSRLSWTSLYATVAASRQKHLKDGNSGQKMLIVKQNFILGPKFWDKSSWYTVQESLTSTIITIQEKKFKNI